jgi:hypothetical protein
MEETNKSDGKNMHALGEKDENIKALEEVRNRLAMSEVEQAEKLSVAPVHESEEVDKELSQEELEELKRKGETADKPELSQDEFKQKYPDFGGGKTYYHKDGHWIHFNKLRKGWVYFNDSRNPNNKKDRIYIDEFYDFIKDYSSEAPVKINPLEHGSETEPIAKENPEEKMEKDKLEAPARQASVEDDRTLEMKQAENQEKPEGLEDEKLKEFMDQVESSRATYATKDYEMTNVWSRLKVLGRGLQSKPEDVPEMKILFDQYKDSLNNLLAYQIEKLKGQELPEAEIESLTKYYNQDEKVNLYNARTDAKAEAWEKNMFGKAGNKIKSGSEKYFNRYKKIGWKKKVGFGVAASLAGAGIPMRILGGVVAGTGLTKGLNERYRRKEDTRLEKERAGIREDLEAFDNPEGKYSTLMGYMQLEIDGYQNDFKTEKAKARNRKIAGALLAGFLGSGAASYLLNLGLEETGTSDWMRSVMEKYGVNEYVSKAKEFAGGVKEKYFPSGGVSIVNPDTVMTDMPESAIPAASEAMPATPSPETTISPDAPKIAPEVQAAEGPSVEAPVQEVAGNMPLTVSKGGSFQGAIIRQLAENGMDKEEAGKMAHKMYMEFLKNNPDPTGHDYSIVHSGAKIELSPDGKHIVNFKDSPRNLWAEKYGGKVRILSSAEPEVPEVSAPVSEQANHLPSAKKFTGSSGSEQVAHNYEPGNDPRFARAMYDYMDKNTSYKLTEDPVYPIPEITKDEVTLGVAVTGAGLAGAALAKAELDEIDSKNKVVYLDQKREEQKQKKEAEKAEKEKKKAEEKAEKEKRKAEEKAEKKLKEIEEKYEFSPDDNRAWRALKCINAIALSQENWRFMNKLKFSDLKQELTPKLLKNINNFEKDMVVFLGEEIRHREDEEGEKGETVKEWLIRVVKKSIEKDKIAERPFRMAA